MALANGKLYFANSSTNAENNTLANFSNNWSEATTWNEGFAYNKGDHTYRNGIYYTANIDLSPTDNTATNFGFQLDTTEQS